MLSNQFSLIKNANGSFNKTSILFLLSSFFERGAYYGIRAVILLYMIKEPIQLPDKHAIEVYGWIAIGLIITKFLGGIIGDFITNNKNALIAGGLMQAFGAFLLCLGTVNMLYVSLGLIILGGGLYTPNLIALFGKSFRNKIPFLDSGFTVFYLTVNIAGFLGAILIGYLSHEVGWNFAFIVAGLLYLIAILISIVPIDNEDQSFFIKHVTSDLRISLVILTILIIAVFWALYGLTNFRLFEIQSAIEDITDINLLFSNFNFLITLVPIGIILAFLWTKIYTNQFIKLTIGLIFGLASLIFLLFIPELPTENHVIYYIFWFILFGIAEVFMAPVLYAVITKYTNSKYLATVIGISFTPIYIFSLIPAFFNDEIYDKPQLTFKISITIISIIILSLILILMRFKNRIV